MTQSQCPGCTVKMGLQSAVREVYVHRQQSLMTEIAGLARAMHKTLPPIKCLKEWWFTQNWQFMAFISFWTCM